MRARDLTLVALLSVPGPQAIGQRLNPVVDLLAAKRPVFGLYAPANRRGRPGAPVDTTVRVRTPDELAGDALAHATTDYIFDGSMEGNFDRGFETFSAFVGGMVKGASAARWRHPLVVKTSQLAPDYDLARARVSKQLNLGVSAIVFVGVESADEVKQGLAMMRFKSKGGTRPDDVGGAPAYWGLSEKDYREIGRAHV